MGVEGWEVEGLKKKGGGGKCCVETVERWVGSGWWKGESEWAGGRGVGGGGIGEKGGGGKCWVESVERCVGVRVKEESCWNG